MRAKGKSVLVMLIVAVVFVSEGRAQQQSSGVARTESLRVQLVDVMAKESELQIRLQQLEEDLRPENIQRSIALIGSLRPEELREQRRVQLEKERAAVNAQLETLSATRARLEASIANAEAEAAREQAGAPASEATTATTTNTTATQGRVVNRSTTRTTGGVERRSRRASPRARRNARARRRAPR